MLKKIKLDNYTTFLKPTIVDFSATNYKFLESENVGENRILKGCLFVGENASGKTKILSSITFLLELLFGNNDVDFMINKSFYTNKKTYKLEYTFMHFGKEIVYFLELSSNDIVAEKLILDKKVIMERLGNTAQFRLNEEKTFTNITSKLSFLRRIYFDTDFYGDKILNEWFNYMKKSVYVNCYYRTVVSYSGERLLVHDYLNDDNVKEINKFLEKINYGVRIDI